MQNLLLTSILKLLFTASVNADTQSKLALTCGLFVEPSESHKVLGLVI